MKTKMRQGHAVFLSAHMEKYRRIKGAVGYTVKTAVLIAAATITYRSVLLILHILMEMAIPKGLRLL